MAMTPDSITEEMLGARQDFHGLIDEATAAELRQRSNGTRSSARTLARQPIGLTPP